MEKLNEIVVESLSNVLEIHFGQNLSAIQGLKVMDRFAPSPEQKILPSVKEDPCLQRDSAVIECRRLREEIVEAFEMAVPQPFMKQEQGRNPTAFLPFCRKGESRGIRSRCWERVVTDRGVCFSSPTGYVCNNVQFVCQKDSNFLN